MYIKTVTKELCYQLCCFNTLEDGVTEDNDQIKLTTFRRREELMMEKYETEMKEKQLNDDVDEEEKKSITEKDTNSTTVVQKRSEPIIIRPKPYPRSMNSQKGRLNYLYT